MKIFLLGLSALMLIFSGCTTTAPNAPEITTYNASKNKYPIVKNQKSTLTYPGSAPIQIAPIEKKVIIAPTDSSTTIAMATPVLPSSVDAPVNLDEPLKTTLKKPLENGGLMIKIAVLVPQKTIRKYAITSVNSVMSFLLYKNYSFDLNVFNCNDETPSAILSTLADIRTGGYNYVIAPMTVEGAQVVADNVKDLIVFIPTVTRQSVKNADLNIVFGGINYEEQLALLANYSNERVGTFEDGSSLSYQLNDYIKKTAPRVFYEKQIANSKVNFKQLFKGNTSLNNASFYLNTPLVTTSLIASQLRANGINPYALLSTQINYNPLLLSLTQYEDRDNLFIANSIKPAPAELEEINALFGHDIVYDWVNYATSIGADYLCNTFYEGQNGRVFSERVENNQVFFNTSIYKPERNGFAKIEK
ncbi:MAG: hypothetical protein PHN18_00850 [Sulfurospirillaceae bacterium]|nr:hypothetical protein [Sulfurospirillaceae bacterium]MDD2826112.1 hypothetical protein [Sulfurospirillaceae bacterium]